MGNNFFFLNSLKPPKVLTETPWMLLGKKMYLERRQRKPKLRWLDDVQRDWSDKQEIQRLRQTEMTPYSQGSHSPPSIVRHRRKIRKPLKNWIKASRNFEEKTSHFSSKYFPHIGPVLKMYSRKEIKSTSFSVWKQNETRKKPPARNAQ